MKTLSKQYKEINVEALKIPNMTKSAKGTVEEPGKNVTQKAGLNSSILAQSWGMFFEMLAYKQIWSGGILNKVNLRLLEASICFKKNMFLDCAEKENLKKESIEMIIGFKSRLGHQ